jgi:PIN domain nuclease of toxin-antitoxin system
LNATSLVSDTHPLLYYFCGSPKKLSKKVKQAFDHAIHSTTIIYIPSTVLWEISHLSQKGTISLKIAFGEWVEMLFKYRSFISTPFDEQTAILYHDLRFHADPFDKAIVASALQLGLPLITNDRVIHQEKPCPLFWD